MAYHMIHKCTCKCSRFALKSKKITIITHQYVQVCQRTRLILLHLVRGNGFTVGQIRQGPCMPCCHQSGPHSEPFLLCTGPRSRHANSGSMVSQSKPSPVSCTWVTSQLSCLKRKRTQASMPGLLQTPQTDTVPARGRQVAPLRARQLAAAQMSHPLTVSFDT